MSQPVIESVNVVAGDSILQFSLTLMHRDLDQKRKQIESLERRLQQASSGNQSALLNGTQVASRELIASFMRFEEASQAMHNANDRIIAKQTALIDVLFKERDDYVEFTREFQNAARDLQDSNDRIIACQEALIEGLYKEIQLHRASFDAMQTLNEKITNDLRDYTLKYSQLLLVVEYALLFCVFVGAIWVSGIIPFKSATDSFHISKSPPANYLDLKSWHVTLPIGSDTTTKVLEYPELATYSHPSHFYWNPYTNGVVLRAHCGGVRDAGSKFARSELQEMSNDHFGDWSNVKGIHSLEITQSVDILPLMRPNVIVARVHTPTEDLIAVRCKEINGMRTLSVDGYGGVLAVLTENYTLGTKFRIKMLAFNGETQVYYNGERKVVMKKKSVANSFRVGSYVQSNSVYGDKNSAYAQVTVYHLQVKHY